MNDSIGHIVLVGAQREYANQRALAEKAIAQLSNEQLFETLDAEANSVAIIMKHVGGNLHSRWRDFLTTDGEKPDRDRDGEFLTPNDTRATVTAKWEQGWATLEATLQSLRPDDLLTLVSIRGESLPAVQQLYRSLAHTAQHCGQIILLAKHLAGAQWRTLSIPRAQSPR